MKLIANKKLREKILEVQYSGRFNWGREMSHLDSLFEGISETLSANNTYIRKVHNESLSHAYIGAQAICSFSSCLFFNFNNGKLIHSDEWYKDSKFQLDPILSMFVTHISSHSFSIISQVEKGWISPCYPVMRTFVESILNFVLLAVDKSFYLDYVNLSFLDDKERKKQWGKKFSIRPLKENVKKVLLNKLDWPKENVESFLDHIDSVYSSFSEASHPTHASLQNSYGENKVGSNLGYWGIAGELQYKVLIDLIHMQRDFLDLILSTYFDFHQKNEDVNGLSPWREFYALTVIFKCLFYEKEDISEELVSSFSKSFFTNND